MRVQLTKIILAASIALALTFTLNACDSGDGSGGGGSGDGLGTCVISGSRGEFMCMKVMNPPSNITASDFKAKCEQDDPEAKWNSSNTCKANPVDVLECKVNDPDIGIVQVDVSLYAQPSDMGVSSFACEMFDMEDR
jgi:hypothetical protein